MYWEERYSAGGDSGVGSYGPTADFKAMTLNRFVSVHEVESVIEFGCGDGNQLSLADYPTYIGLDVSSSAVRRCIEVFADDDSKSFLAYDPKAFLNRRALVADLALSLDVILHLVEDDVFDRYMRHLFGAATRYVAVFSPNEERVAGLAPHVRFRAFLEWVSRYAPEWNLLELVENPDKGTNSVADFYFFERNL